MRQFLWKAAQVALFIGLTVLIYERGKPPGENPSMAPAMIIALGLTVIIFAPFLHLSVWLRSRKERVDPGPGQSVVGATRHELVPKVGLNGPGHQRTSSDERPRSGA